MSPEQIKLAVKEAIEESSFMSNEEHRKQHEVFTRWIERDNRRKELIQTAKKSFVGAFTIAIFGWLSGLGEVVMAAFK